MKYVLVFTRGKYTVEMRVDNIAVAKAVFVVASSDAADGLPLLNMSQRITFAPQDLNCFKGIYPYDYSNVCKAFTKEGWDKWVEERWRVSVQHITLNDLFAATNGIQHQDIPLVPNLFSAISEWEVEVVLDKESRLRVIKGEVIITKIVKTLCDIQIAASPLPQHYTYDGKSLTLADFEMMINKSTITII